MENSPVYFTANKKDLMDAVKKVKLGVSKRSTLPILRGYLFDVKEDGIITIRSTNLEIQIAAYLSGKTDRAGRFVVDASSFEKILKTLPKGEDINFAYDKEEKDGKELWNLGMFVGETNLFISTLDSEDYPKEVAMEKIDFSAGVKAESLIKAMKKILPAASLDQTRPVLTGVLFEYKDSHLHFVATDSYRLAQEQLETYHDVINTDRVIKALVPGEDLTKLLKIINKKETVVIQLEMYEDTGGSIIFLTSDTKVIVRCIQGEFPKYKQLIPEEYKLDVIVNREAFLKAMERAEAISASGAYSNPPVKVTLNKDKLIIETKIEDNNMSEDVKAAIDLTPEYVKKVEKQKKDLKKLETRLAKLGKSKKEKEQELARGLSVDIANVKSQLENDENIVIGYNPNFIITTLKAIEDDEVRMQMQSRLNPTIFRGTGTYSCLIMPVRISG